MLSDKTTFALFFGNRGFFPASLQASARKELTEVLKKLGHKTIALPISATRNGAVETPEEGRVYADFLRANRGKFGGVIVCLPNFGDETGAVAALRDAGVPILIQAYPDELDKMAPALRRDSFCGKFSIMDVFTQYGVPFTVLPPHTAHPAGAAFAANVEHFDRICRVAGGMKRMVVAAVGARTTPFKTVRFDELALQRHGITTETLDLSDVFARMKALAPNDRKLKAKIAALQDYSSWAGAPAGAIENVARLGVVLDAIVRELGADALALRCWLELQQQWSISPCVLLSQMNEGGLAAACELDVASALAMRALGLAAGGPPACLDWNNNYGDADDKCILFHCGPVPASLMTGKGRIADQAILANVVGEGHGFGCNTGRIAPVPFTFGNLLTDSGKVCFYLGEGRFTEDPIPDDFFGCAGVAEITGLQAKLQTIGYQGHRHHVAVAAGHVADAAAEAFTRYLGYCVTKL